MTGAHSRVFACALVWLLAPGAHARAAAQSSSGPSSAAAPPPPPPPLSTIARDTEGRATVRATRVTVPVKIDGHLDEDIYRTIAPASDFIQMEPEAGRVA